MRSTTVYDVNRLHSALGYEPPAAFEADVARSCETQPKVEVAVSPIYVVPQPKGAVRYSVKDERGYSENLHLFDLRSRARGMRWSSKGVIDDDFLFRSAGALAILAGLAAYQVVDALRWKDRKRSVIAIAALSVFAAAAGFTFLFAHKHATFNFWSNAGLGSEWECSYAPSSARVCDRDLPAQLRDHPPPNKQ